MGKMGRRSFLAGAAALAATAKGADEKTARKRDVVVYVSCHPDDVCGSIGTLMRLQELYDVHVIEYTHGERGLGEAHYLDGTCAKARTAEDEAVCRAMGVPLHWCNEIDGEAFAGREACAHIAEIYRKLQPRAIIVHWLLDTHRDHMMSAAAAIKATELAKISPEIYFQEQDIQSRGFPADYYVDVTKLTDRRRELISLYQSQWGPRIAERKIATSRANGFRIWGNSGRFAEVIGVLKGTVPAGKGIFDALPDVYR